MHRKNIFPVLLIMLALVMLPALPTNAWVYPDSSSDPKFEQFGPRADRLLMPLFADDTAEFAALKAGDIDITDWPLSKTEYDIMTAPPYNETIKVVNYGAEYGEFILDMNSNGNEFLGNPPNPDYPNPKYPNPMSDVNLRRAIGHLIDRTGLIADPSIGEGFGVPLYTTMVPAMGPKYILDVYGDPTMPWAWEYSPTKAEAILDAAGYVDTDGDGWRNDPATGNNLDIDFFIRSEHPGRKHIGDVLKVEMENIGIKVTATYGTIGVAFIKVMVNKDFHLYTGGWLLGVDPDFLILWSWDWYWHPGFAYNYGGHNDALFNEAADRVYLANDQDEAATWALIAQERQARMVLGIPLYAVSGNKAYYRTYTGSESPYTGLEWQGVVNIMGYGIDNGATFMNMFPTGYAYDHGDPANPMTIRYGFKTPSLQQLNPVYASWLYDWNVLDKLYSSLLDRNASALAEFMPSVAKSWELGTYPHPIYGTSSKVKFTLRPDISWSDGYALTVADVYFTFVELKQILESRGLPPPWWYSNVQDILSFSILDPCNFEVLLGVKSYWALGWVGGNIILPKHIWKPIAETHPDPQSFAPDPNLIGSGPWRFVEYIENSHVLAVANRAGRTVTTNLAGSEPITAQDGFTDQYPIHINVHPLIKFENVTAVVGENWVSTLWHQIKGPDISTIWHLSMWLDMNLNGLLDQGDRVEMTKNGDIQWFKVFMVEQVGNVVYIKVDWWTQKIPVQSEEIPYTTPVEMGVTLSNWMWADEIRAPPAYGQPGPDLVVNKYVYLIHPDGTKEQLAYIDNLAIPEFPGHDKEQFNLVLPKGKYIIEVDVHIKAPDHDSWKLYSTWKNYTFPFWITRIEDITGATLEYYDGEPIHPDSAAQIPTPDVKVDIKDIARAALAFGTYPGHEDWDTAADINGDYKIDIKDIAKIAIKFGFA